MNNPTQTQVGGDHYKNLPIQPAEYIAKNKIGFFEGCAIKYITRHKSKNGVQDINKAIHFLEMLKWWMYGISSSQRKEEITEKSLLEEKNGKIRELERQRTAWMQKASERRERIAELELEKDALDDKLARKSTRIKELENGLIEAVNKWDNNTCMVETCQRDAVRLQKFVDHLFSAIYVTGDIQTKNAIAYVSRKKWEELKEILNDKRDDSRQGPHFDLMQYFNCELTFSISLPTRRGQIPCVELYTGIFRSIDMEEKKVDIKMLRPKNQE